MSLLAVFPLILMILAPAALLLSLWKKRELTRFEWLIKTLYTAAFLLYVLVIGRWDWVSVYLRWVWVVLFVLAALVSYRDARRTSFYASPELGHELKRAAGSLFALAVFLVFLGLSVRGYFYSAQPVNLTFPLRDGRYYVAQGGNSTLINYHNSHPTQKYALDIVALNPSGARAAGLTPNQLDRYVIYGADVYAPCDGTVVTAVDGLPDLPPSQADPQNPAGNHLIIACPGADVLLAHLYSGSIRVEQGAQVTTADGLARVGNSGSTSEPHLHIHAAVPGSGITAGQGIPMQFDGRFLVRSSLVEE